MGWGGDFRCLPLLQAEEGFACLKGALGCPNFHQTGHRVEAHIFIPVLACHLLCRVRERLSGSGDTRDWKTLRRQQNFHQSLTILSCLWGLPLG